MKFGNLSTSIIFTFLLTNLLTFNSYAQPEKDLYTTATAKYESGKVEEAIEDFTKAIEIKHGYTSTHFKFISCKKGSNAK